MNSHSITRHSIRRAAHHDARARASFLTALLFSFLCFINFAALAADTATEPSDIYKSIDVRLTDDTMKALHDYKGKEREDIIHTVTQKPGDFAPPVLFLLSSILFDQGQKDDSMFWLYAGQLRGRIDANICADKTARVAIAEINRRVAPRINQYAFTNISKLTNTVERVLAWEEKTPCTYDRRWINLHGKAAMNGETNSPLSVPKEQWEAIRKQTRVEYRTSLYQAVADVKKGKH
jgi:hypothetical protein